MHTYYYQLYGLTIASPLEFPEALEIPQPKQVDATFFLSPPPEWVLQEYEEGKYASITENIMWFRLEKELLIYVENGKEVRIHLLKENMDPLRLRSYILSGALTFLLFQHNYILVHGSALVSEGKVYLISGPSGSGKSTTALELLKRPEILFASDDICAIQNVNGETLLYPGPPWQKVCADVREKDTRNNYVYLDEVGGKYAHRLTDDFITDPLPVGGMFIISRTNCEAPSITEVTGVEKLHTFTHNLFRGELLNLLGNKPQKMIQMLEAINRFPLYDIERPEGKDTLAQITRLILDKL